MMKLLDTIGGFLDLLIMVIILPVYILTYSFIASLILLKYSRVIKKKIVQYISTRKRPSYQLPLRLQWKFI